MHKHAVDKKFVHKHSYSVSLAHPSLYSMLYTLHFTWKRHNAKEIKETMVVHVSHSNGLALNYIHNKYTKDAKYAEMQSHRASFGVWIFLVRIIFTFFARDYQRHWIDTKDNIQIYFLTVNYKRENPWKNPLPIFKKKIEKDSDVIVKIIIERKCQNDYNICILF